MNTFNEAASMSVFCRAHPLAVLRRELRAEGVVPARQLRRIPSGRRVRISGLLVIVHTPPTKSGKRVMFLTLEDETGLLDAVVFSKAQKDCAQVIYTSELLTLEGRLHRQSGNGLSISVVVDKVILPWSGKLSEFLPRSPASGPDRNLKDLSENGLPGRTRRDTGLQNPVSRGTVPLFKKLLTFTEPKT
jgi:DNA polymerase III alpha subunit